MRSIKIGLILLGRVTGVNWTFYVWTGVLVGFIGFLIALFSADSMADGTAAAGTPELQQIGKALRQLLAGQQSQRTRVDDLSQAVLGTGSSVQVTQAVTEQVVQQVMTQVQQQNQERIGQIAQAHQQTQDQLLTQVGTALQQMQEQMRNMGQAV